MPAHSSGDHDLKRTGTAEYILGASPDGTVYPSMTGVDWGPRRVNGVAGTWSGPAEIPVAQRPPSSCSLLSPNPRAPSPAPFWPQLPPPIMSPAHLLYYLLILKEFMEEQEKRECSLETKWDRWLPHFFFQFHRSYWRARRWQLGKNHERTMSKNKPCQKCDFSIPLWPCLLQLVPKAIT